MKRFYTSTLIVFVISLMIFSGIFPVKSVQASALEQQVTPIPFPGVPPTPTPPKKTSTPQPPSSPQTTSTPQTTSAPKASVKRQDYCEVSGGSYDITRCLTIAEWVSSYGENVARNMLIGFLQFISGVSWNLGKFAVNLGNWLSTNSLTNALREAVLNTVISLTPGIYKQLVFDNQKGLFVFLYMISALLLTIPFVNVEGLPKPGKVLSWGMILTVFFVSSTLGYDLLRFFDDTRIKIIEISALGNPESSAVKALVADPFMATPKELTQTDDLSLPGKYKEKYFPDPKTTEITVQFLVGFNGYIEIPADNIKRLELARQSFWVAVGGFFGALSLAILAISLLAVNLIALVAIVLFFIALPVGFFSSGQKMLWQFVYLYITSIIMAIMLGVFSKIFGALFAGISAATATFPSKVISVVIFNIIGFALVNQIAGIIFSVFKKTSGNMIGTVGAVYQGALASPLTYEIRPEGLQRVDPALDQWRKDAPAIAKTAKNTLRRVGESPVGQMLASTFSTSSAKFYEEKDQSAPPSAESRGNAFENTGYVNSDSESGQFYY